MFKLFLSSLLFFCPIYQLFSSEIPKSLKTGRNNLKETERELKERIKTCLLIIKNLFIWLN